MFVFLKRELVENFAVWVWKKLIVIEGETDRMILNPSLFFRLVDSLLLHIISELVIAHQKGICTLSILNTIWVIVVLRRRLDDVTLRDEVVQKGNVVRHLACLVLLDIEIVKLFLQVDLVEAKKIVWKEAYYLMTILLPILSNDLNSLNWEKWVLAVPHGNVWCIYNNKRFFTLFCCCMGDLINLFEKVFVSNWIVNNFSFFLILWWLGSFKSLKGAINTLKMILH